ncbi:hypothetical protein SAMN04487916_104119 [Arthrobacter sp. ov407]|uniref:hypothetical protein n=1 Tax=Arthrobacter sp. ov407 TaxID=1761748 RepID=UPI0008846FA9|nr:hypothetical protein [Arthrobacter sp. ov407]SDK92643.1 hypothetical protein SAMN04487916_104119 [Arthrobacter sp. ov407]
MMQEGLAGTWAARGSAPSTWLRRLRGRFDSRRFLLDEYQIGSAAPGSFLPESDQEFRQRNFRPARVGLQQATQPIPGAGLSRRRIGHYGGDDLGGLQAYPPYLAVLRRASARVRGRILL